MFEGRKVSHVLPYHSLENQEHEELVLENRKHLSISGMQEKLSLRLVKNQLRLTEPGDQGQYILKPIPRDLKATNGDAHLKNFSLIHTDFGDHILSPAYDLICTALHIDDTYFALHDGLFSRDFETDSFHANGFYAYDDFYEFGKKIGLPKARIVRLLDFFRKDYPIIHELIHHSFLSDDFKIRYESLYANRLATLNYSFEKRI